MHSQSAAFTGPALHSMRVRCVSDVTHFSIKSLISLWRGQHAWIARVSGDVHILAQTRRCAGLS
jgi:hypothetical protein